jgi:hypothetical protein
MCWINCRVTVEHRIVDGHHARQLLEGTGRRDLYDHQAKIQIQIQIGNERMVHFAAESVRECDGGAGGGCADGGLQLRTLLLAPFGERAAGDLKASAQELHTGDELAALVEEMRQRPRTPAIAVRGSIGTMHQRAIHFEHALLEVLRAVTHAAGVARASATTHHMLAV